MPRKNGRSPFHHWSACATRTGPRPAAPAPRPLNFIVRRLQHGESMPSIKELLLQNDPLTRESVLFLAKYAEEDDRLDYKREIDPTSEKYWLEITKDISAFANTHGGFLLFGVDDRTKEIMGLSRKVADAVKDANNLHQKINRHLEPHISRLRAKEFKIKSLSVVAVYIPRSVGVTHMISKDGVFSFPSEKQKSLLRKGTFYVRRSAGNHL